MPFLRVLEGLRTPALDAFFSAVTYLGDEIAFFVLALTIFWCVSKHCGYYVLTVGFFGTIISQVLKLWCRVPRPWVLDSDFTIVESARAAATGYSFPSGHTQNAVGTLGALARFTDKKWLQVACLCGVVLVPLSRMYLGVHTPLDVGVAFLAAAILVFVLYPAFGDDARLGRTMVWVLAAAAACTAGYLLFVTVFAFPADTDAGNLAEGVKNAYTMAGAVLGLIVCYVVDSRCTNFDVHAPWYGQVLKVVLGLGLCLAVKSGLKAPLLALLHGSMTAHAIRYFCVVVFAGCVWPLTFPFFARLGRRKQA